MKNDKICVDVEIPMIMEKLPLPTNKLYIEKFQLLTISS